MEIPIPWASSKMVVPAFPLTVRSLIWIGITLTEHPFSFKVADYNLEYILTEERFSVHF
jgi:hypothetical protein